MWIAIALSPHFFFALRAGADTLSDCNGNDMPTRIAGCTELLKDATLPPADRALALSLRSDAYAEQKQYDKAIGDLEQAAKLQPNDPTYKERLAWSRALRSDDRLSRNELPGAIEDLQEAVKLADKPDALHPRLGKLYEVLGKQLEEAADHKGAAKVYGKLIELEPKRADAYALRATARGAGGDQAGALSDYTEAIALKPDWIEARLKRSEVFLAEGMTTQAIQDLDYILKADPKNITAHLLRGNAFESAGADKRSDARRAYEAVLSIEPTNEIAKQAIARLSKSAAAGISEPAEASIELVRDIQAQLKRLGCYQGEVDGKWGMGSAGALRRVHERKAVSGRGAVGANLTEETLRQLVGVDEVICDKVDSGGEAGPKLWNHNGSIMTLSADGNRRRFFYHEPRSGIRAQGVSKGTLLFEGERSGGTYSGTAYIFSKKCGTQSYSVSGSVSEDEKTVTMTGQAPRLDNACRKSGVRDDVLVFSLIEGGSMGADDKQAVAKGAPGELKAVSKPDLSSRSRAHECCQRVWKRECEKITRFDSDWPSKRPDMCTASGRREWCNWWAASPSRYKQLGCSG